MAAWQQAGMPVEKEAEGTALKVSMYITGYCPYCGMAERLLRAKGVQDIEKIRVDLDPALRAEMMNRTRRRTVPQIYIGEIHVGWVRRLVRAGSGRAASTRCCAANCGR